MTLMANAPEASAEAEAVFGSIVIGQAVIGSSTKDNDIDKDGILDAAVNLSALQIKERRTAGGRTSIRIYFDADNENSEEYLTARFRPSSDNEKLNGSWEIGTSRSPWIGTNVPWQMAASALETTLLKLGLTRFSSDLNIHVEANSMLPQALLLDIDRFPNDRNEWADYDGDGTGNNSDVDDDNDSLNDDLDAFPLDASEYYDTDFDRVGNNADTDDDGDGVPDSNDAFPLDANESLDTDGDGIGNNADTDDDGDGVADSADALPLDADETLDTDNDGIGNNADTDDDGDGYSDQHELEMGSDPLDSDDMPRSGGLSPALLRVISQGVIKDDGGG